MLKEALLSAKQQSWASALPELRAQLQQAEQQTLVYSRNLLNNPNVNVQRHQEMIANRNAELVAQAINTFFQSYFAAEADAEAAAVIAYLQAHNSCIIVPLSMANSGGTVEAPGGTIATITYRP